jgi:hypothetical protein
MGLGMMGVMALNSHGNLLALAVGAGALVASALAFGFLLNAIYRR